MASSQESNIRAAHDSTKGVELPHIMGIRKDPLVVVSGPVHSLGELPLETRAATSDG